MITKAIQQKTVSTIKMQWLGITIKKRKKPKLIKTIQTELVKYA